MTEVSPNTIAETVSVAPDEELAFETLGTEKLRVMVLLIIVGSSAAISLIPPTFFAAGLEREFQGNMLLFLKWRFLVLGGLVLYLCAERALLSELMRHNRRIPLIYPYVTAFIETSCPPAAIIVSAVYTDTAAGLWLIPVFTYPLFIVLS